MATIASFGAKCESRNPLHESFESQNRKAFFVALIISLLIHLAIFGAIVAFWDKKNLEAKHDEKKVKLAFKRGGDSKKEDSKLKENTSIPQKIAELLQDSLPQSHESRQSPQSAIITPQDFAQDSAPKAQEIPAQNDDSNAKNNAESSNAESLNMANLQIYNNPRLNPNLRDLKYKNALNHIMAQNVPSDQKMEIIDLYGDELGDYGLAELDFLLNNLRDIGRITQYHINRRGYPKEAALLGQSGKNVIEFYLHPNGDISELRVVSSSNSMILDNDMQTNIKVAFREYPRPAIKVKIRFFMSYHLF